MHTGGCEYLEWDSQFFGLRIARLTERRLTCEGVAAARRWCEANQVDCLYFLADSDDAQTVTVAQANDFQLVDIRVTLERRPGDGEPAPAVRPFQPADAARLRTIARVSHRDSRFYSDARFPRRQCDAYMRPGSNEASRAGLMLFWLQSAMARQPGMSPVIWLRRPAGLSGWLPLLKTTSVGAWADS
jgi:hypothetical protein